MALLNRIHHVAYRCNDAKADVEWLLFEECEGADFGRTVLA